MKSKFDKLTKEEARQLNIKTGAIDFLVERIWQGNDSLEERWMKLRAVHELLIDLIKEVEDSLSE